MKSKVFGSIVGASALAIAIALSAPGPVGAEDPSSGPPAPAVPIEVQPGTGNDAQEKAVSALQSIVDEDPDRFAGLSILDGYTRVRVNYVGDAPASPEFVASVEAVRSSGIPVEMTARSRSFRELQDAADRIAKSATFGTDAAKVASWGVDTEQNAVLVGVEEPSAELLESAAKEFGDSVIVFQRKRGVAMDSRNADQSPFDGGARISGGGGNCTAGFSVVEYDLSASYMMTAGHCAGSGATGGTFTAASATPFVGTVTANGYANAMDALIIGGTSYTRSIFSGSTSTTTKYRVYGATNATNGQSLYLDGSTSGRTVGTVSRGPECMNLLFNGVYVTGCSTYTMTGASCAGGDSGAPVWKPVSGTTNFVMAVGIFRGGLVGGNECYYTAVPAALSYFFKDIKTS